jgi:hypothetical protein
MSKATDAESERYASATRPWGSRRCRLEARAASSNTARQQIKKGRITNVKGIASSGITSILSYAAEENDLAIRPGF